MKKLTFLLIVALFFTTNIYSQKIAWGPVNKINKNKGSYEELSKIGNNYYSTRRDVATYGGGSLYLDKFDENFSLVSSKKLEIDLPPGSVTKEFYVEEKLVIVHTKTSLSEKSIIFNLSLLDLNGNIVYGKEIATAFIDNNQGSSIACISKNKKFMGILAFSTFTKSSTIKLTYIRYNLSTHDEPTLITQEVDTKTTKTTYSVPTFTIDNKGRITSILSFKKRSEGTELRTNKFIFITDGNNVVEKDELTFGDYSLQEISLESSSDGQTYFSGMYSPITGKKSVYNGFFIGKLNTTTFDIDKLVAYPYNREFFNKLGYKIKKDGSIDFNGKFELQIVTDRDRGGFVIAERANQIYYGELVVLKFDSSLNIKYESIIPKGQKTNNYNILDGFGYVAIIKDGDLNLFYNDTEKNIDILQAADAKFMSKFGDSDVYTFHAKISAEGSLVRKLFIKNKDYDGYLKPDKSFIVDENVILNYGFNSKTRYGVLSF
ncbi:MAG: hypothetical protein DWP98_12115 [Bacteroidetes bacterium]|nr:MAG: hypothetical protein DWP98_12115 [Bacteroidota bacterium]MBL1143877.1 hypothetical protein [Bacteroidota bacterium]MCB0801513.1 hypothetical protein [Flavobacteriales bacterium]NOG56678.1 hypothetical protein [Bacteroidota bacterium]